MFFYQALIMLVVVIIICVLAYALKLKNRAVLVVSILLLATAGAMALAGVQNYFGVNFYTQNVDSNKLKSIKFSTQQLNNFGTIFSDYDNITEDTYYKLDYSKKYEIDGNGAHSQIKVNIVELNTKAEAVNYYQAKQKLYDNKVYLPADGTHTIKNEVNGQRFIVSYIKSYYKDYSDIIYLPSKMAYLSDVVFEDNNIVITISETANKPVTNKNAVLDDILKKLQ